MGVEFQVTTSTCGEGRGYMGWKFFAKVVELVDHVVRSLVLVLKVKGLVEMVDTEHVRRQLDWVDGDEVLEGGVCP